MYFMQQGNRYRMTPSQAVLFKEKLPVGTYTVGYCDGYYFEVIDDLTLPKKLYGNTAENADRILNTFNDRPASTGVLLSGKKGSGKTLLAKVISAKAAAMGIPTLVINTDSCSGDSFNQFVQKLEQPVVLIFDEFEKIFNYNSQTELLTLLDGMYPSKKLFVLTSNEAGLVNENMIDRPGRVFYVLHFEGVDIDFVRGYCKDNLDNPQHVAQVVSMFRLFATFTFDILKALVEEMNRYKENPARALRLLNARPDLTAPKLSETYEISLEVMGRVLDPEEDQVDKESQFNIFGAENLNISHRVLKETKKEKDEEKKDATEVGEEKDWAYQQHHEEDPYETEYASFSFRDLVKVNSIRGVYHFENSKRERLVLTRTNRSGALDLEWLCSLEEPLDEETATASAGAVAGQITDVVRLDTHNNNNCYNGGGW